MATLTIRKLDDEVYERLREQARANNRSLEAEARQLISENVRPEHDFSALLKRLEEHRARMGAKYGVLSDSAALIRQMRDEDG